MSTVQSHIPRTGMAWMLLRTNTLYLGGSRSRYSRYKPPATSALVASRSTKLAVDVLLHHTQRVLGALVCQAPRFWEVRVLALTAN
eukprot:2564641-Rhodomonas_salina.1